MLKKKERSNFENKYGGKTKKNVSTSNWAKSFDKSKGDQQF